MIISFNGDHGSGKSTIAQMVATRLNYPRYYMGKIFRDLAEQKGITLAELHKICENDPAVDKQVDEYLVDLAKKENNFVIESRTAWHFIPDSIKIYLRVDEKTAAERIFKELQSDTSRKTEDAGLNSIEKIIASERKRKEKDDDRYLRYYGINIRDDKNYDLVLDTTNLSIEEVFKKVLMFVESKINVQPS